MRTQTTLATAMLIATGILLGDRMSPAIAEDKKSNLPFTPAQLVERTLHRRAVEAVIWGMPAVNAELMFQAAREAKGDFNQFDGSRSPRNI